MAGVSVITLDVLEGVRRPERREGIRLVRDSWEAWGCEPSSWPRKSTSLRCHQNVPDILLRSAQFGRSDALATMNAQVKQACARGSSREHLETTIKTELDVVS